jgi:hypothetical protein
MEEEEEEEEEDEDEEERRRRRNIGGIRLTKETGNTRRKFVQISLRAT